MTKPLEANPALARKSSLLRALNAVAWSFFGVRKSRDLERDASELKPAHVIVVAAAAAAVFVIALVLLVNWVIASGVAS